VRVNLPRPPETGAIEKVCRRSHFFSNLLIIFFLLYQAAMKPIFPAAIGGDLKNKLVHLSKQEARRQPLTN